MGRRGHNGESAVGGRAPVAMGTPGAVNAPEGSLGELRWVEAGEKDGGGDAMKVTLQLSGKEADAFLRSLRDPRWCLAPGDWTLSREGEGWLLTIVLE